MDVIKADHVATILTNVAGYGGQHAKVFLNYALIAENIPCSFEAAISILDATVTMLQQVLNLVKDQAEGKKTFSDVGLAYAQLLGQQSASTLAEIEPIIAKACLEGKDCKSKRNRNKKEACRIVRQEIDPLSLELDEKDFSRKVETAKWSRALPDVEKCMERLYDLQLHLLLLCEVVTVGALSRDLSSGKVDIQSIVTYHDRIHRTADLIGIKAPGGRQNGNRRRRSFTSGSESDSSSDSDSDVSTILSRRKKKSFRFKPPPPPPPPPPAPRFGPGLPPVLPPPAPINLPAVPLKVAEPEVVIMSGRNYEVIKDGVHRFGNINPPAYTENKSGSTGNSGPVVQKSALPQTSNSSTPAEKASNSAADLGEKADPVAKDKEDTTEQIVKSAIPEGRLFKSPSSGLGFKIKSTFQSKESLAAEMKRTLSDSQSHLIAYVVQRYSAHQVPHSTFHTLEATHMKTILSQLNSSEWYKTFTTLDANEHRNISRILNPWPQGKIPDRELVVLKVLERNRFDAWMALLRDLLKIHPLGAPASGRVLLAIVREKLVDGKPPLYNGPPPPFSPQPALNVAPTIPSIPPPPLHLMPHRRTTISDLKVSPSPPPPPGWPTTRMPGGPPPRPYLPPPPTSLSTRPPPPPPPGKWTSVRTSDITLITESDANAALTTYNEYTICLSQAIDRTTPLSWNRVAITQETSDKQLILQRIEDFTRHGGNVIESKLRLAEPQCSQLTRLMDDLRSAERDHRFQWTWAEISPYNSDGKIPLNGIANATRMHLIAKRSLKMSYKALDVYKECMKPPPPPQPPVSCPTIILQTKNGKKYADSSDESDSDTTCWSSEGEDDCVGNVRMKFRRSRARKVRNARRMKDCSRSDSDSEDGGEDDVIEVKVQLKKGDDLVKVLLDRWTPEVDGKEKEKVVV